MYKNLCKNKFLYSFSEYLSRKFGIIYLIFYGGFQMSKEINYQEEIKNCKSVEALVGKNRLMKRLFKDVMQQLLDA